MAINNCANHEDVLRRVEKIEEDNKEKFRQIEEAINGLVTCGAERDVRIEGIKGLVQSIDSKLLDFKSEVVSIVSENTKNTWGLINHSIKIIMVLVLIIVTFSGVKMYPELFKIIGGV